MCESPALAEVDRLRAALETSERERASERTGRIRAEQALRVARAAAASAGSAGEAPEADVFPLVPIGYLHSVFSQRNGTPRQPLLAPSALSRLVLAPHVPEAALEGLTEFSHVWVLYVFHENTNLACRLGAQSRLHSAAAKVHVPRLNGAKRGVLATRSPHRPTPLGLSVGVVLSVKGRTLTLGGLDCVDGSPVLDVKPYLPFCDAPPHATAPSWAQAETQDGAEPLAVACVRMAAGVRGELEGAWGAACARRAAPPLYDHAAQFTALVEDVLSRDIRSAHQRERGRARGEAEGGAAAAEDAQPAAVGKWRVTLDGVNVGYEVDARGEVTVTDARLPDAADVLGESACEQAAEEAPSSEVQIE